MNVDKTVDTKKPQKKKRGFVSIDLGELKEPWEKYCHQNRMTPSKTLREIVKKLTGAGQGERIFQIQEESLPDSKNMKRMVIRWTPAELDAIQSFAEGCSSPKNWVIDCVRAKLTKSPQFGMNEIEALGESCAQLMKIGTNLNQIARAINRNPLETDKARIEIIELIRSEILEHTSSVQSLINANLKRWDIK